ncbi:hypothetical protein [Pseudofrankia sp. DC12]|uniref:AAA family ATPase n=1 Tax=Pseudofrankia sp. DC12 TaxID=683315 RepID=UPI0005F7B133|nr:hypothetical protein [Pseudofrankia sp. DC12]
MSVVVPLLGPPGVGKSTLAIRLGAAAGCVVFRLREQVPAARLEAAGSAGALGWMDEATVATALDRYLAEITRAGAARCVVFDNFPGTPSQVVLLLGRLAAHAPASTVVPVELSVDAVTLRRRAVQRRVCHRCERDPAHDPRLPAQPSLADRQRCGRCGGVLHPRRGDAPSLLAARLRRYRDQAAAVRGAFRAAGIAVGSCDCAASVEETAAALTALIAARSTS